MYGASRDEPRTPRLASRRPHKKNLLWGYAAASLIVVGVTVIHTGSPFSDRTIAGACHEYRQYGATVLGPSDTEFRAEMEHIIATHDNHSREVFGGFLNAMYPTGGAPAPLKELRQDPRWHHLFDECEPTWAHDRAEEAK